MRTRLQLRIVSALGQHRNFSIAASSLGMGQPALSRALMALEQDMGVKLFDRSKTSVTPTVYGEIVLARCEALLTGFDQIERSVDHLALSERERFRISAGPFAAELFAVPALSALVGRNRWTGGWMVVRDWRQGRDDLLAGQSDMAIGSLAGIGHPDLEYQTNETKPESFFCRKDHPLLDLPEPTLQDITAYPWTMTRLSASWLKILPADLGRAGTVDALTGDFIPAVCVDSLSSMKATVASSLALCCGPVEAIRSELDSGLFRTVPLHRPWMTYNFAMVWHKDRPPKAGLVKYIDVLRRQVATFKR